MIKNILNKLPRKHTKSVENHGGSSTFSSNSSTTSRTNFGTSSRSTNSNATILSGINSNLNSGLNYGNTKVNGSSGPPPYEALPSFKDVPNGEKQNLFIKKLSLCCVVFDFTDPSKYLKEKDIKRQTLVELVDYITSSNGKFNETIMQESVRMISVNLFRTHTAQPRENKVLEAFDLEEDEPLMDPSWPHLQIVYEFLLRFIASPETDAKLAKRPKCLPTYHQQLSYCITQFVEKDCKLADTVIWGLLKYWPITNSSKEVMFIGELEEVLEATQPPEFQRCMVRLFRQIGRCLSSSHFQVAERALFLWNNDHIENLIKQNRKIILPIIFPSLEKNSRNHWNQAVQSLTLNVRKIFSDVDPELFEECLLKFQEDEAQKEEVKMKRESAWKRLEEIAAVKDKSNEPVLVTRRLSTNGPSGIGE
ncbi:hypothetical protein RD792_010379 [Penstemon davidsonii]|uniref:Serine/threonine protein phosphatase 2A regulatory subunit n=1 Tax=Penstemon davidsonii TaxID=160366 RepID=A0ABR0D1P4_9LAMI|nr:hypothetical protein RD792_010379 [Penstemon davidsonii]